MKTAKISALVLTGALLIAACGNKEQKSEANVNENPVEEKVEVKAVEGRKNFSDKSITSPSLVSSSDLFSFSKSYSIVKLVDFSNKVK